MTIASQEWSEALRIDAAHPSLPGHFPEQPVVAGVILLDRLAARVEARKLGRLCQLTTVKFRAPLLPGEQANMQVSVNADRLRFRVTRGDELLADGEANLA